jgi:hypothetical protein
MLAVGITKEFDEYIKVNGLGGFLGSWDMSIYDTKDRLICKVRIKSLIKTDRGISIPGAIDCDILNTGRIAWFKLIPSCFSQWEVIGHVNSESGIRLSTKDIDLIKGNIFTLDTLSITKRNV